MSIFIFLFTVILLACDDKEAEPPQVLIDGVSSLSAQDVSNNGDASDIEVRFSTSENESEIQEYRIFVVGVDFEDIFDRDIADEYSSEFYQTIDPNGSNQVLRLEANLKSVDGLTLEQERVYLLYILTVSGSDKANRLSSPSNAFRITSNSDEARNLVIIDTGNDQNSSDIQLSFDPAFDEDKVASYRAIIVKASEINSFGLNEAINLSADRYFEIAKNGASITTTFSADILDSSGESIANDIVYNVFILSVEDGERALQKVLSKASNDLTLLHASFVKTISGPIQASGGLSYHPDGYLVAGNSEGSYQSRQGSGIKRIEFDGTITEQNTELLNCLGNGIDPFTGTIYQTTRNGVFSIETDGTSNLYEGPFVGFDGHTWLTYLTDLVVSGSTIVASDCQRNQLYTIPITTSGVVSTKLLAYNDTLSLITCPRYVEIVNSGQVVILNNNDNILYSIPGAGGFVIPHIEEYAELRAEEKFLSMDNVPSRNSLFATTSGYRIVSVNNITGRVFDVAGNKESAIADGPLDVCSFLKPVNIAAAPDGNEFYILDEVDEALGMSVLRKMVIVD